MARSHSRGDTVENDLAVFENAASARNIRLSRRRSMT